MADRFTNRVRHIFHNRQCPSELKLAAYADRQLIGADRHRIESHLSDCNICAQQVAFLVRSDIAADQEVPPALLHQAGALAQPRNASFPYVKAAWASALLLLLAIVLTSRFGRHQTLAVNQGPAPLPQVATHEPPTMQPNSSTTEPELRGSDRGDAVLIYPTAGQHVPSNGFIVRWKAFKDAARYEVVLLSDDGSIVWSQSTKGLIAPVPSSIHLAKGRTYFIKITVRTTHGSAEQTRAVAFIAD